MIFIFQHVVKKKTTPFSCMYLPRENHAWTILTFKLARLSAHVLCLWSIYFFSGEVHLVIHNLLLTRIWTENSILLPQTASFAYIVQESEKRLIVANAVSFSLNAKQYIK